MANWKKIFPSLLKALIADEAPQTSDGATLRTERSPSPTSPSTSPPPTRPSSPSPSSTCSPSHRPDPLAPAYRCRDCVNHFLMCKHCIINAHQDNPLHRIDCWQDGYFVRTELSKLGLRVYLGHGGQRCPNRPKKQGAKTTLTVVHTSGIHAVKIRWCSCLYRANDRLGQLISHGLFPGSPEESHLRSAFSIEVLRSFHMHSSNSNEAGKDFIATIGGMTNSAFPGDVKVGFGLACIAHLD